ncbi:hypothetical protein HMPREF1581_01318, partial [Gardnerella vaginalis JCP8108]
MWCWCGIWCGIRFGVMFVRCQCGCWRGVGVLRVWVAWNVDFSMVL